MRGLRLRIWETPAVVPPPPPVPTPSQINWVTGRRLHALHSIRVAGVVNGWLTPIWQKLWTVASEPRPCHHASAAASSQSRQKFLSVVLRGMILVAQSFTWKWTVQLDEGTVKYGTAETRAAAMNSAVWMIDKALAPKKIRPKPPPSD